MHPDDLPPTRPHDPAVDRRFTAIVSALGRDDPDFVRRHAPRRSRRFSIVEMTLVVGLLVAVLFGVLPLALGLQFHVVALAVVGCVGCAVLPVLVPWAMRRTIRRHRPLWT